MSVAAAPLMEPDDFLLWCLDQEGRWELVDGVAVEMMAGASDWHDAIVVNTISMLREQLRGKPCRPTTADLALRTRIRSFRRPDVMVNCAPLQGNVYEALEPRMAVEVLSKSNTGVGWQRKLEEYRRLKALDYILLIDSHVVAAKLFIRSRGDWEDLDADLLTDVIDLPKLGCRLQLSEIYEGTGLQERLPAPPQTLAES